MVIEEVDPPATRKIDPKERIYKLTRLRDSSGFQVYDSESGEVVHRVDKAGLEMEQIRLITRAGKSLHLDEVGLYGKTKRYSLVFSDTPCKCEFYDLEKVEKGTSIWGSSSEYTNLEVGQFIINKSSG